ncbi:hypothetical protein DFQ27_001058 [Actinomortierella ambigua]|uniref:UBA domain-containing protein n=1 Tax=Actinomortierella ambigua TaxID=1343610 RepID=A0A9P6U9A2_9FUNG|nr:hypothetical protein DFQ27_001058 [Actinomortierella ambigua]
MDDLSGLSWTTPPAASPSAQQRQQQQQQQQQLRNGANAFMGMGSGMGSGILQPTPVSTPKVKPPVPPVSSKPAHLQMGRQTGQLLNTSTLNSNLSSTGSSIGNSKAPTQPSSSRQPPSDVFGSLIPDFGKGAAGLNKSLDGMSLDDRRRHLQQQQQQQQQQPQPQLQPRSNSTASTTNRWDDFSMLSNSLLSTSPSPSPSPLRPTTGSNPTPLPTFNPGGIQSPVPQGRPLPAFMGGGAAAITSSSRVQSPGSLQAGSLQAPLQPSRSGSTSPTPARDPFGSLLGSQSSRSTPLAANQSLNTLRANTPPVHQPAAADPWDLDFLANTGSAATKTNGTLLQQESDTFDLGAFEKAVPEKPTSAPPKPPRPSGTTMPSVSSPPPLSSSSSSSSSPSSASTLRRQRGEGGADAVSSSSASPPTSKDSLVAIIVDMGFTAQQAKTALAMTPGGNDVEAAVDLLVQNKAATEELSRSSSGRRQQGQKQQQQRSQRRFKDDDDDDDEPSLVDRRRQRQQQHERTVSSTTTSSNGNGSSSAARTDQFNQQKDRFVESASAFGFSVLSKASDLYKQGKEKMQAVMDDITAEDERVEREERLRRHQWVEENHRVPGGYKDSDSEEEDDESHSSHNKPPRSKASGPPPPKPRRELVDDYYDHRDRPSASTATKQQQQSRRGQERENFEGTYVSSSRRGGAQQQQQQQRPKEGDLLSSPSSCTRGSRGTATATTPVQPTLANRGPSAAAAAAAANKKPVRPPRTIVQASGLQMQQSNQLKEQGNALFKLGQFGQAAEMYAQATASLPANHLSLVILHNNRAAALIKTGDYRETVEVCTRSIGIIQGPDGEGVNDVLPSSSSIDGSIINLKEQMSKALMRRATAYENMEKYKDAKRDWTLLRELDPSNKAAFEGLRRCDKAIQLTEGGGSGIGDGSGRSTPLKKASPVSNGSSMRSSALQDMYGTVHSSAQQARTKAVIQNSEGVSKLREAARQQEKEEDEKLRVRDQVDQRMGQWKAGKEDNLRALIASLHTVLWEGAGWKAVGMHELVTASQVKVKYMRAIGKMHPDKLGGQTTIEQRMMANTIFSTLNSAWDAFKVQNNM